MGINFYSWLSPLFFILQTLIGAIILYSSFIIIDKHLKETREASDEEDKESIEFREPRLGDMLAGIDTDRQLKEVCDIMMAEDYNKQDYLSRAIEKFRYKNLSDPTEEVYFYKRLAGMSQDKVFANQILGRLLEMNEEYDLYHEEMLIRAWLGDILHDLGIWERLGEYTFLEWVDVTKKSKRT